MKLTVRNYHLDGYGHVNNARYLEFLEEARWTFFQEHDLLSELKGIMLVLHASISATAARRLKATF